MAEIGIFRGMKTKRQVLPPSITHNGEKPPIQPISCDNPPISCGMAKSMNKLLFCVVFLHNEMARIDDPRPPPSRTCWVCWHGGKTNGELRHRMPLLLLQCHSCNDIMYVLVPRDRNLPHWKQDGWPSHGIMRNAHRQVTTPPAECFRIKHHPAETGVFPLT